MTFIEGVRLLLDMAKVDKTVVSKTSCTGYDKSNDKTGVATNRASLNNCDYLELVKFTDDTYQS